MIKQEFFEKKVLNQEEIDNFWKEIASGKINKGPFPVPVHRETTKQFVGRIDKWMITFLGHIAAHENIRIESIQYNEDLSECVVVYER